MQGLFGTARSLASSSPISTHKYTNVCGVVTVHNDSSVVWQWDSVYYKSLKKANWSLYSHPLIDYFCY